MSDERKPDQPSPSSGPPDFGGASESDIDRKLSDAAALARELGAEVGTETTTEVHPSQGDPLKSIEKGLDEELRDLEHLVQKTRTEVGADSNAETTSSRIVASPQAVPDFMAEFMSPEPAPDRGESDRADVETREGPALASSAGTTPDVESDSVRADSGEGASGTSTGEDGVGTRAEPFGSGTAKVASSAVHSIKPGVVGSSRPASQGAVTVGEKPATGKYSLDVNALKGAGTPDPPPAPSREVGVPVLMRLCEMGVAVLEKVDRPTAKLGDRVREAAGVIAIATAATAAIVLLISLL